MFGRKKPDVLVVGAGPVGLFTALSLARRGIQVQIVDKEWRTAAHAYGLALHAGSLRLLKDVGLMDDLLDNAYRVDAVGFYDSARRRAGLQLSNLAVIRQDVLETMLEDALKLHGVKVHWNHRVAVLDPQDDHVAVAIDKLEKGSTGYAISRMEWIVAKTQKFEVPFVVGADGHRSFVRRTLGIDYPSLGDPLHFAVFEFKTDADLQHEMRVVMDDGTTNVLWPLPGGRARWSFQLTAFEESMAPRRKDRFEIQIGGGHFPVLDEGHLHTFIEERAPWFEGSIDEVDWRLVVRFERRLAEAFGRHRMWLAGDAGHMTGPVGIQSMNVGLREGHDLAKTIAHILQENRSMEHLEVYNHQRLAEWRYLLGLDDGLKARRDTDPWVRKHADRLLPCLPASGDDLARLAEQLGLETEAVSATI